MNGFYDQRCFFVIQSLFYKYLKLWQRQQMPKTYKNIKVDFLRLKTRYRLSLRAQTWLQKLRIRLQISNELRDDVLRYI